MAYDNSNKGALFRNAEKKSDTDRDYNGQCEVGGVKYWISAWLNKSKKGDVTYLRLAFSPQDERAPQQAAAVASEEVPF